MRRLVSFALLLALAGAVTAAAPATAPRPLAANVTGVVSAETLVVRYASGATGRVALVGVRPPAKSACYADASAAEARRFALGQRVQVLRARGGAYVSFPGGVDLGRVFVSRGLAQIDVWGPAFARFASYVPAQQAAEAANLGMWAACAADISVSVRPSPNPVGVGGQLTYTVTVANSGPLAAPGAELELRPPAGVVLLSSRTADGSCEIREWLGTCRFSAVEPNGAVTATFVAEVRKAGTLSTRALVRLAGCVRLACGAEPLHDSNVRNDATAALSSAVEGTPPPPAPPPPPGSGSPPPPVGGCHPSYPSVCIPPPPPDLDCADIPYRDFAAPLSVPDPDPHDLDGDEDGVGCQFNDY